MSSSRGSLENAKSGRNEKSLGVLSKQYSSRDLPSHLKLKYRQSGQGTTDDLKNKDFKKDLQERERVAFQERESKRSSQSSRTQAALPSSKKLRTETNIDADEPIRDEEEEDSSDSDEDDTEELLAELNRIKKERAQEEAQKEAQKKAQEEKIRMENILSGNPLLNSKTEFKVKRRWDDDVVFKNCAKNDFDEREKPFINDTLRSQFHKKFMEKYIK